MVHKLVGSSDQNMLCTYKGNQVFFSRKKSDLWLLLIQSNASHRDCTLRAHQFWVTISYNTMVLPDASTAAQPCGQHAFHYYSCNICYRTLYYLVPTMLLSVAINVPRFFELMLVKNVSYKCTATKLLCKPVYPSLIHSQDIGAA